MPSAAARFSSGYTLSQKILIWMWTFGCPNESADTAKCSWLLLVSLVFVWCFVCQKQVHIFPNDLRLWVVGISSPKKKKGKGTVTVTSYNQPLKIYPSMALPPCPTRHRNLPMGPEPLGPKNHALRRWNLAVGGMLRRDTNCRSCHSLDLPLPPRFTVESECLEGSLTTNVNNPGDDDCMLGGKPLPPQKKANSKSEKWWFLGDGPFSFPFLEKKWIFFRG